MWWAVDVQYGERDAVVGGVGFVSFSAARGVERVLVVDEEPAEYEPGLFYKRELPYLIAFLEQEEVDGVVVDGFVWLGGGRKGLGAYLHEALRVPVIGVAKRHFEGASEVAQEVLRGGSERGLWVTAVGIELEQAARWVGEMHGHYRIPSLLKRADRLAREA